MGQLTWRFDAAQNKWEFKWGNLCDKRFNRSVVDWTSTIDQQRPKKKKSAAIDRDYLSTVMFGTTLSGFPRLIIICDWVQLLARREGAATAADDDGAREKSASREAPFASPVKHSSIVVNWMCGIVPTNRNTIMYYMSLRCMEGCHSQSQSVNKALETLCRNICWWNPWLYYLLYLLADELGSRRRCHFEIV